MSALHLPGCPLADSAVPASTCTPCHYIRVGIDLGREMPRVDPRHEPGIGSLVADGVAAPMFRTLRGWTGISGMTWTWPELTAPGALSSAPLRVAYSTTPYPGRTW